VLESSPATYRGDRKNTQKQREKRGVKRKREYFEEEWENKLK